MDVYGIYLAENDISSGEYSEPHKLITGAVFKNGKFINALTECFPSNLSPHIQATVESDRRNSLGMALDYYIQTEKALSAVYSLKQKDKLDALAKGILEDIFVKNCIWDVWLDLSDEKKEATQQHIKRTIIETLLKGYTDTSVKWW